MATSSGSSAGDRPRIEPGDRNPDHCRWCGSAVSVHRWPGGELYRCGSARCLWLVLVDGEGALEQVEAAQRGQLPADHSGDPAGADL